MNAGREPVRSPRLDPVELTAAPRSRAGPNPMQRREHLAVKLFVPLALALVVLTAFNIITNARANRAQLRRRVDFELEEARQTFARLIRGDSLRLQAALEAFANDDESKRLFVARDREALYEHNLALFERLRREFRITHFYFITPDGTCFLRLHAKDKHGDAITRFTFERARAANASAAPGAETVTASGIEPGKTAFALRVVRPYVQRGELIGYVEFGEEIDHLIEQIAKEGEKHVTVFADKRFLDRARWASVAASHGRPDTWDMLEDSVVLDSTLGRIPSPVRALISREHERNGEGHLHAMLGEIEHESYGYGYVPLIDAGGRDVGDLLVMYDLTEDLTAMSRAALGQAAAAVLAAVVLAALFLIVLRRTLRRLAASRSALRDHAARLDEALEREKRISQIISGVLREGALDKALQQLSDATCAITGAELGVLVLLDRQNGRLRSLTSSNCPVPALPDDFSLHDSPVFRLLLGADEVICIDDMMAQPAFTEYSDFHPNVRALIGTALRDEDGLFGLFAVANLDPGRRFAPEQANLFAALADLAGMAIRRALTIEELRRAAEESERASAEAGLAREVAEKQTAEAQAAYDELLAAKQRLAVHSAILEAATRGVWLDETLRAIAHACLEQLSFDAAAIYVLDAAGEALTLKYTSGVDAACAQSIRQLEFGTPAEHETMLDQVEFGGADELRRRFGDAPAVEDEGLMAYATIPLGTASRPVGVFILASHTTQNVPPLMAELVEEIQPLIQPIVANALQTEDLDRFNRAAAGREDRVIQVKQEVNELLIELGREPKYASTYEATAGLLHQRGAERAEEHTSS